MPVLTINSAKLDRTVRVCDSRQEARQVWQKHPEDRSGIYLAEEVRLMRGIAEETLQLIQMAKDIFQGATVQRFDPPKGESNELAR